MRYIYFATILLLALTSCKENKSNNNDIPFPCEGGLSDNQYACENIDLFAVVTPQELQGLDKNSTPTVNLNDIWGWTDSQTGKEYALVGLTNGVSFVDVSDPSAPIVIGKLNESNISAKYKTLTDPNYEACKVGIGDTEKSKSLTEGSVWRDHKVFDDHLFIGSDAQSHGVQVFDLTKLRAYSGSFLEFDHDALYSDLANSHNIVINEETGFAYAVGATNADTCNTAGLHIIDINDPANPTFAGCYEDTTPPRRRSNSAYIHDAQCVIYDGLDSDYAGKEICFNAAERSLVIADVTDKNDLKTISFATQPNMYYAHQGWLTEDQNYFLMNDELDEYNLGRTTKTYIFDVRDLDNPVFIDYYEHNTQSIDHNLYVKNDYVYASNYVSGLRILSMDNLASAELTQVGFFDSEPSSFSEPNREFEGAWSSYPYFNSGTVVMSDINRGLFILKANLD
ncbi:MAG: choice-of-anchor B family protein [Balneola sp.]